jgi:hypothetical protein
VLIFHIVGTLVNKLNRACKGVDTEAVLEDLRETLKDTGYLEEWDADYVATLSQPWDVAPS